MYKYAPIQADETHNIYIYRGFILRKNQRDRTWEAIPALYPVETILFEVPMGRVDNLIDVIDRYWKSPTWARQGIEKVDCA